MKAKYAFALFGAVLVSACAHGRPDQAMAPTPPAAPVVSSSTPPSDAASIQSKRLKSAQRKNGDPTKSNAAGAAAGSAPPN